MTDTHRYETSPPHELIEETPVESPPEPVGFEPEERDGRWFAVDRARDIELAPVFDLESTAAEVGRKCYTSEPFFDRIPVVPRGTKYPRPHGTPSRPHQIGKTIEPRVANRARRIISHRPNG